MTARCFPEIDQPNRPIRLVALDLDGTILDRRLNISLRVQAAVRTAIGRGIHVTLATGRTFSVAQVFAERLGVHDPLICVQGALVQDAVTGARLLEHSVPRALAWEVIELAHHHGWDLCVYLGDDPYVERLTKHLEEYASYSPETEELRPVGDLRSWLAKDPLKVLLTADADRCTEADRILREHFVGRLKIVRSFATFVEATSLEATKGQALAFMAQRLGVPQIETMAVGDNDNDLDMITWAGLGVAMGNSSLALRAAARAVCPDLASDGAAVAIEQWILGMSNHG
jgi:Cof subfamily protein (haloacid dehalogenase superfamily)